MGETGKWHRQPDMDPGDWAADETSIRVGIITELKRLKRRMKAQPIRVLLLASLMTFAVIKKTAGKQYMYKARVILRASEGSLSDDKGAPIPGQALREYIYNYVLTKEVITKEFIKREKEVDIDGVMTTMPRGEIENPEIRSRHAYFVQAMEDEDVDFAVEEVKAPLSIGVQRNYFLMSRARDSSTPRSMHLIISYADTDPEFAYWMADELSNIVVENVHTKRLREARFAARNAHEMVAKVEAKSTERRVQRNELMTIAAQAELDNDRETAARAEVALEKIDEKLKIDEMQLEGLRREEQNIEFRLRVEERRMALVWEVAGEIRPRALPPPGPIRLTAIGLFCFCIFVPICAIWFGTFDSKIHELEDVTRLGMPIVGHIPAFKGDRVGSLKDRGALAKQGILGKIGFFKNRRLRDNRIA